MKDFTKDSIICHLLQMAAPLAVGLIAQIAYQLVDLYFVAKLGASATAGVNAAGNAIFVVAALAQILSVGTVALIAQTVGQKDRAAANVIFNQSALLSFVLALLTAVVLQLLTRPYMRSVAADQATLAAGVTFMLWVLPGYVCMIPMAVLSAALRGTGIVYPQITIYVLTVVINIVLAPLLIAGWGTGVALGVPGAGLATSISIVIGTILLVLYFRRSERYLAFEAAMLRPRVAQWGCILHIGLPAGGELVFMFLSTAILYYAIRGFGAPAQAGFGIGSRVLQALLLPGIAIAFAAGPIAGQNYGARNGARVKETFRQAALIVIVLMGAITLLMQRRPDTLVALFDAEPSALHAAIVFLQLMSWTVIAQSLICVSTNMFQGLGNTLPALISSAARFLVLSLAALWLSTQQAFRIEHVWYLSIACFLLQAVVSLWLLRAEFKRRLVPLGA